MGLKFNLQLFAILVSLCPVVAQDPKNIVQTAIDAGSFGTLKAALDAADLTATLRDNSGPFTVFAPTDAAFQALGIPAADLLASKDLGKILTYHVVAGDLRAADLNDGDSLQSLQGAGLAIGVSNGGVTVSGARVTTANIVCTNGVIHIIDAVLQPPTIVEAALSAGSFGILTTALEAAGLVDALSSPGPFTVFAPTDAAFAALGVDPADLLQYPNLGEILTFHVVGADVRAADLSDGLLVQSLQGARLEVAVGDSGAVSIGNAGVSATDIVCGNGVIHVIDAVLLPPARLPLVGGTNGWVTADWSTPKTFCPVRSDGLFSGEGDSLLFSGEIGSNGKGFTSIGVDFAPVDLSNYAGLWIDMEAAVFQQDEAPLGIQVRLRDESSSGKYGAPLAVPVAATSGSRVKAFLSMGSFNDKKKGGFSCSWCMLNTAAVNGLDLYVHYQSGAFQVRLFEISAVMEPSHAPAEPPAPPVPALAAMDAIPSFIRATINSGGYLYDKKKTDLSNVIYTSATKSILNAPGVAVDTKGVMCAGLLRARETTSHSESAWILRRAFDAVLSDSSGHARQSASRYPSYARGGWLPTAGAGAEASAELCMGLDILSEPTALTMMTGGAQNSAQFAGPFEGYGITGFNDLGGHRVKNPQACTYLCGMTPGCRSVDYGARGAADGECWLSTANRASAGDAYSSNWALYDYYEKVSDRLLVAGSAMDVSSGPPRPGVLAVMLTAVIVMVAVP